MEHSANLDVVDTNNTAYFVTDRYRIIERDVRVRPQSRYLTRDDGWRYQVERICTVSDSKKWLYFARQTGEIIQGGSASIVLLHKGFV